MEPTSVEQAAVSGSFRSSSRSLRPSNRTTWFTIIKSSAAESPHCHRRILIGNHRARAYVPFASTTMPSAPSPHNLRTRCICSRQYASKHQHVQARARYVTPNPTGNRPVNLSCSALSRCLFDRIAQILMSFDRSLTPSNPTSCWHRLQLVRRVAGARRRLAIFRRMKINTPDQCRRRVR